MFVTSAAFWFRETLDSFFTAARTTAMLLFTLATILAAASAHLCTLNPLQRGASNINGFINTAFAQECYLYTGMRIASLWLYVVH